MPVNGHWIDADPQRMPLGRLLAWTGQSVGAYYRRTVAAHGLSATGLRALGVLGEGDPLSHRDLAGRLGVTPATLTPVIDALAGAGAVRREGARTTDGSSGCGSLRPGGTGSRRP